MFISASPDPRPAGPLVMGASGCLGRALKRAWPAASLQPVWQSRDGAGGGVAWDILNAPPPHMPHISGVVVLAGVVHGSNADLAANTLLAQAGVDLGRRKRVPVLVASTQAVYGPQQGLLREDTPVLPQSDYGRAKLKMELAVAGPGVTCLRIGNVAGCDALAKAVAGGAVTLDRFADGRGPRRAMLTATDLVQVILALLALPQRPAVLNVARPGLVEMADLLTAAGVPFDWQSAGPEALPELALDVTLLQRIYKLPAVSATALVGKGGWL